MMRKTLAPGLLLLLAACVTPGEAGNRATPTNGEKVTWQSVACTGTPVICHRMDAVGYFYAKAGATAAVMITHGSQGLDSRLFEYADAARQAGFAALVIDHWTPRGITVTHNDYVAATQKGGNEFNMAFDSLTAAAWLRQRGFAKVGSIGESQGGGAAITLVQKWIHDSVNRNVSRLYGRAFTVQPLDAVVGMYGFCGIRNAPRDAYLATPFLFITGAEDDETPSRYCEQYVPWMNGRGAAAKIVVLPDVGHSFDAPYRRQRNAAGPHYAACNLLVEAGKITELNSGTVTPGQDVWGAFSKCVRYGGYHSGYVGDRFVAVPHWTGFFRETLR
jgi:dienelactone hydrolase